MTEQLTLGPGPSCTYCGPLGAHKHGEAYVHKCSCPHRTESFCQAHPVVCDEFTDIRNEAWRKNYQISELRGETWDDAFGGAT